MKLDLLLAAAEKHDLTNLIRQFAIRHLDIKIVMSGKTLDHLKVVSRLAVPSANGAAGKRQI